MEELVENCQCQLCDGKNGSSEFPELVPVPRLTNCLANQKVFDALLQSSQNTSENKNSEPKLYFKLVPNCIQNPEQTYFLICSNCSDELTKLDQLTTELESIQKLVESQVQKINVIRQQSEQTLEIPALQFPMCGWTEGYENVWNGWQALGNILETVLPAPVSREPESSSAIENGSCDELVETSDDYSQRPEDGEIDQQSSAISQDTDIFVAKTEPAWELASSTENEVDPAEITASSLGMENTAIVEPECSSTQTAQVTPSAPKSRKKGKKKVQKKKKKSQIAKCHLCSKTYNSKGSLNRHIYSQHTDPSSLPLACPQCPRRFSRTDKLKYHIMVHTGEKPFSCNMCDAKFREARCLERHKAVHKKIKPFRCPECAKCYTRKADMKYHILHKHASF